MDDHDPHLSPFHPPLPDWLTLGAAPVLAVAATIAGLTRDGPGMWLLTGLVLFILGTCWGIALGLVFMRRWQAFERRQAFRTAKTVRFRGPRDPA